MILCHVIYYINTVTYFFIIQEIKEIENKIKIKIKIKEKEKKIKKYFLLNLFVFPIYT